MIWPTVLRGKMRGNIFVQTKYNESGFETGFLLKLMLTLMLFRWSPWVESADCEGKSSCRRSTTTTPCRPCARWTWTNAATCANLIQTRKCSPKENSTTSKSSPFYEWTPRDSFSGRLRISWTLRDGTPPGSPTTKPHWPRNGPSSTTRQKTSPRFASTHVMKKDKRNFPKTSYPHNVIHTVHI